MILLEPARTQWDLRWSMLGIPVRVHPLFWLMALLLVYSQERPFSSVLTLSGCIFVSILVHEFGHALAHRHYGDDEPYVVLYHFGGLCVGGPQSPRRWPRISILLWGPLAGFILGGIAKAVQWSIESGYIQESSKSIDEILRSLIWVNLIWGLVNLIPVFPLDGGQIMREVILWKAPRRGDPFVFKLSGYTAVFMAALALAYYIFYDRRHNPHADIFPIIFFAVLAYSSFDLRRQLGQYGGLDDYELPQEPWERDADWWKK